jgi:anaerobic dimethyl sulfoxide reductase subunit C (anchor subunit)
MRKVEWSLVFFTLFAQVAIGLFLILVVYQFFQQEGANSTALADFRSMSFLIIDLLLVTAVLAATYHLDRPINAYLAMANLKKSWLSREMLLGLLFGCILFILSLMSWLEIYSPLILSILLIAGSVVGLALLYAISRIYMLRTVPTWNSVLVPLSFFITSFLLGSLLFGITVIIQPTSSYSSGGLSTILDQLLDGISTGSVTLMFIQILLSYLILKRHRVQAFAIDSAFDYTWTRYRLLFMLRLGSGLIGITLYINFLYPFIGNYQAEGPWGILLIFSFLMLFLSETCGRILFYASYKKAGI